MKQRSYPNYLYWGAAQVHPVISVFFSLIQLDALPFIDASPLDAFIQLEPAFILIYSSCAGIHPTPFDLPCPEKMKVWCKVFYVDSEDWYFIAKQEHNDFWHDIFLL